MITHEIQVVIPEEPRKSYSHWLLQGQQQQQRPREMSKIEYAQYIEGIKKQVQVGDILIGNYDVESRGTTRNCPRHRFFEVLDIQEIHTSVRYVSGRPECLYLKNLNVPYGDGGYWTCKDSYDVVPYDELPDEVKQIVDARNNREQTSTQ